MKATPFRSITNNIHLVAKAFCDVIGWSTISTQIKRAQIHDRRDQQVQWAAYPANRFGWVAFDGTEGAARFVGVGVQPKLKLNDGEFLLRVELPFEGCGRDLRGLAANEIVKAARRKKQG